MRDAHITNSSVYMALHYFVIPSDSEESLLNPCVSINIDSSPLGSE